MNRPSFQFYPGDWQSNSNLRRCTHAEKGAWVDAMCLLHDQAEYGVLRWPLKEIALAIGAPLPLLRGLITKGVLKGDDKQVVDAFIYTPRSGRKNGVPVTLVPLQSGPIWYSSRMVRDEYVRTIRGESTRFGAEDGEAPKGTPKAAPKPPFGDGSSSSSPSSSPPTDSSEAKASGGKPPMSADEIIFSYGLGMLTSSGIADKQARSFLGGLRKGHGDDVLINTLRECAKAKPLQPLEWLAAALPPEQRGTAKPRGAPLESFAEQDRKAGIKRWEEMTGRIHPENQKAADVIDITPRQERIA